MDSLVWGLYRTCTILNLVKWYVRFLLLSQVFVQQGRLRYMPTISLALPWCRRATRKQAPFWARGPLSHPNQQPLRFAWYSCSLPRRHSLMRKTSIPWQGRWFGVNNYCSYSIVYIINIQGLEYIYNITSSNVLDIFCSIFFVFLMAASFLHDLRGP